MRFFILILINILCHFVIFKCANCFNDKSFYFYLNRHKRNADTKKLEPPKLNAQATFVMVVDDATRVDCKASGYPTPNITWYIETNQRNVFELIVEQNRFMISPNGVLEITPLTNPDVIYCKATNELGTVRSKIFTIQKWQNQKDVKILYDSMEVYPNQKAVVSCKVEPQVFSKIYYVKYWEIRYKDESKKVQQIYKTNDKFSVINRSRPPQLHIRNVTLTDFDQMEVRCVMKNMYTNTDIDSDSWTSLKKYPVHFDMEQINQNSLCKSFDVRVIKGSTLELPWCSKPTTESIVWLKRGWADAKQNKINLNGTKFKMINSACGNLLIKNIGIAEEGLYYAYSSTKPNINYLVHTVRVMINVSIEIKPPIINARYNDIVKLECIATGYPSPSVLWLHNGMDINRDNSTEIPTISSRTSTLTITVNIVTAGVYQCLAESRDVHENRVLSEDQKSVFVIITEMAPMLISQFPSPINPKDSYGTGILQTDHSSFNIQCEFNRVPNGTVAWYLDDQKIPMVNALQPKTSYKLPYTVTAQLNIDLSQLTSIGDKWKYGGEYRAEVTNKYGKAHCTTLMFVNGVYEIRDSPNITLIQGEKLSLKCYVISASKPNIAWFRRNGDKFVRLPDTHTQEVSDDGRVFTIQKVDKIIDSGSYMCNSTLNTRKNWKSYVVNIANPPILHSKLPDQLPLNKNSERLSMSCHPKHQTDQPWYAWWEFRRNKSDVYKPLLLNFNPFWNDLKIAIKYQDSSLDFTDKGEPLPRGVPKSLRNSFNKIAQIWVNYNEELHLSNISCVVQNHAGVIRKIIPITINNLAFVESPPGDLSVILGDSFSLHCTAKPDNIQLKTIWFHGDSQNDIQANTTIDSRIHQLPNGTLVVNKIELTDSHKFICIIKSVIGKDEISKVVKIVIKVPATIISMNDTVEMKRNTKNLLNCTVHGDENSLQIEWWRKEHGEWKLIDRIKTERVDKISRVYVEFDRVNDSNFGEYKCLARNNYTKHDVERIIQLHVVDVPESVFIKNDSIICRSRSVTLSWNSPNSNGKKPITGYVVSWHLVNNSSKMYETVSEKTITIGNLRPFKNYVIIVCAKNSVGCGSEVKTYLTTLAEAPEGPVLGLTSTAMTFDKVKLMWKSPDDMLINGKKKYYQVCLMEINDSRKHNLEKLAWPFSNDTSTKIIDSHNHRIKKCCITVDESSTETNVSELLTFTEYAFRVILINNVGSSPPNYVSTRTLGDTPEGSPIHIRCTATGNSLSLMWNPPPQNLINGLISGYEVTYYRNDKQEEPDKLMKNVNETKLILSSLLAYSNYTILVRVKNTIGLGPHSEPEYCTTKEAEPDAPNEVKAYSNGSGCIKISWTPPIKKNGKIRLYQVEFTHKSKSEIHNISMTESNKPYYTQEYCNELSCEDCTVSVSAVAVMKGRPKSVKISTNKPGILSFSRNIVIQNTTNLVLDCEEAFEDKATKKTWTKNNVDISNLDSLLPNGSLAINPSEESIIQGVYKCRVNSEEISYNISMKSTSLVPQNPFIEYTKASTNRIFVSWRSNGFLKTDDPINKFIVVIKKEDGTFIRESKVPSNKRNENISNLECGTQYTINVYAENINGRSQPNTVNVRTRGSKPEIPDTTNIIVDIRSNSMCFDLKAFRPGHGCPANSYQLELSPTITGSYKESENKISKFVNDSDLIKNYCFNVTDLHPNTDYRYVIKAANMVGSIQANGHNKTLQKISIFTPSINYSSPPVTENGKYLFVTVIISSSILFVIGIISILVCVLKKVHRPKPHRNSNNNNNVVKTIPSVQSPVQINRNRKLPTPPDNIYDKGTLENIKHQDNEEDEMLQPYATYESIPKPDPMTSRDRPNRHAPYNTGSQAHSYQYPEILPPEPGSGSKIMTYQNDLKQPLLNYTLQPNRPYDQGYSRGSESLATLRPQIVTLNSTNKQRGHPVISIAPGSVESEAYRPSSSLCSSTTESSTKDELCQFFRNNHGNQFSSSRLQEQDEDGASTARGNRSTLINRSHHINNTLSDDSTQPESYCESGSSGDDCGIRNFTQDPPGQQVIAPLSIRKINPRSNSQSYDTVNRQPFIQQSNNFTLQLQRNRLQEEDEGEEASNYTNNFVVV